MSLNNVPTKAEVMGWNPQCLSNYMRKLKLSGCDKVVMKGNITGAQFMDNDSDYEGPQEEEEDDESYICALTEPQTAEQEDSDEANAEDYGVPSSADTTRPPRHLRVAQLKDGHFRGDRKKPVGLDPSWYGGNVTRHQAEAALREVNKDGAFVVRDSSKGSDEHPYTLMLLKQGKVYNIKIRNHGNSYSLGTGLNTKKSFPGVKEMITHHTHTPLLLIDATDQSSEAQSQCCLLHPAGL
ncbi:cytokine-dependent hematopoietic cell linker [Symphorus nematophorus]